MTTATTNTTTLSSSRTAFHILHFGFALAPILFGLDKFFNITTNWVDYLPTFATDAVSGTTIMAFVGVVEIVAGIGVWLRPDLFAYVVAAWLALIIITLLAAGGFLDVALRDFGLLLGALALGQLAREHA